MRLVTPYLLTVACAVAIALLMLGPVGEAPPPFPHFDKIVHVGAFAVLAFPLCFANSRHAAWVLPAGFIYGAVIELVQPYTGRTSDWLDLLADAAGLGLGWIIARGTSRALGLR